MKYYLLMSNPKSTKHSAFATTGTTTKPSNQFLSRLGMVIGIFTFASTALVVAQDTGGTAYKCNNSFEKTNEGLPVGWRINHPVPEGIMPEGVLRVVTKDAKDGTNCIEMENTLKSRVALYAENPGEAMPGTKIKLSIYVKGHGTYKLGVYYYTESKEFFGNSSPREKDLVKVDSDDWSLETAEVIVPSDTNSSGEGIFAFKPEIYTVGEGVLQFDCFSAESE